MNHKDELKALNGAHAIFKKYQIDNALFDNVPGLYIIHEENVYDIINEIAWLFAKEHPLWVFPKKPNE